MSKCDQVFHTSIMQLPVSTYFDDFLYQKELDYLFSIGPKYIGHELMIPNIGNYHTLQYEENARMIINDNHEINLVSNVCRHRQALILQGFGTTQNIVCPLHLWTYEKSGELISAPHFETKPCLNLNKYSIYSSNGMIFEGDIKHKIIEDLNHILKNNKHLQKFNFEEYRFHSSKIHECNYNWKTFIEVYLEDYHVNSFHPGLGNFVNCDNLEWQFSTDYSIQTVGIKNFLHTYGSKIYKDWHTQVLNFAQNIENLPKYGAIWLTYYPNIMVEWYPYCLVISILHPNSAKNTKNVVEFYYPEEIALFEPDFISAHQAAYMETYIEDDEIAIRMEKGRKALYLKNINEYGPYQSPMEDGMRHFHEWYRKNIKFEGSL